MRLQTRQSNRTLIKEQCACVSTSFLFFNRFLSPIFSWFISFTLLSSFPFLLLTFNYFSNSLSSLLFHFFFFLFTTHPFLCVPLRTFWKKSSFLSTQLAAENSGWQVTARTRHGDATRKAGFEKARKREQLQKSTQLLKQTVIDSVFFIL